MAQTKPKAGQFYGVSGNGTDGQFLKSNGNGTMSWDSPVTNPTLTSIDYPGAATAADTAGGETILINGTNFLSGVTCTVGGTSVSTTLNSVSQISITSPAKAAGQYDVVLTNSNGGAITGTNFIQYSGIPIWTTSSGSLGNVKSGSAASFQVTATEGSDTIEYAVTTGSLPSGLSLNTNTGAITGTAPSVSAATTTTFSITATDDENQTSSARSFSITVNPVLPSDSFNTILYTGTGSSQSITSLGFQPDFVWIKARNATASHGFYDSIRGVSQVISSESTSSQTDLGSYGLTTFNSNGFSVSDIASGGNGVNGASGGTYSGTPPNYVAWCWKAGGSYVTNTDYLFDGKISANPDAGFSIVETTTGDSTASVEVQYGEFKYNHGLSQAPELIITKITDQSGNWDTFFYPNGTGTTVKTLQLNLTASAATYTIGTHIVDINSTFAHIWNYPNSNTSPGRNIITYNFHSVDGYQKIGSYTGTGTSNGNFVETGFEPAFLMVKRTDGGAQNWLIFDNKRSTTNPRTKKLAPNLSSDENNSGTIGTDAQDNIDFYDNGFKPVTSNNHTNISGGTFIYLAIAADPDTTTPTVENSFDVVTYTGTSSGQSISTDFKPDLVWIKNRSAAFNHALYDSVRGAEAPLFGNTTSAEDSDVGDTYGLKSFDSGGFTLGYNGAISNTSGNNFVAWCWKAGDHDRNLPTINTTGSINSLVSANQNAGFSIVKYKGTGANATVGHGLSSSPELIFVKTLDTIDNWMVLSTAVGATKKAALNANNAFDTDSAPWNDTAPTSTVFTVGTKDATNKSGDEFIAYCWHSVTGYSKIGTYSSSYPNTPAINVGFAPKFVLIKSHNQARNWVIHDTQRGDDYQLYANLTSSEGNIGTQVQLTSTGFEVSGGGADQDGGSGYSYIYLAIA